MLGSTATYVVVAVDDARVDVEVVEAPGLVPGTQLKFAADAVATMEHVNASPKPAGTAAAQHAWQAQVNRAKPIR